MPTLTETFIFGAANSLHCAGMCGPLAMCFRGGRIGALTYHLGRVAAYALVGAAAGALGTVLGPATLPSAWISIVLGGVLAVMVVASSRSLFGGRLRFPWLSGGWSPPLLGRVFTLARSLPPASSGLLIGLVTPLLPCGVLYIAVGTALVAGDVGSGAATLAAFALGALPVLLFTQWNLGLLTARLGPDGRARLFHGLMLLAAAVLVYRGAVGLAGAPCH